MGAVVFGAERGRPTPFTWGRAVQRVATPPRRGDQLAIGLVWLGAVLVVVLTMAIAPAFDGPNVVRRSGMSTPGAGAAQLAARIGPALASLETNEASAGDVVWTELLSTADMVEAALADFGPNGRPLADRVRTAAGPVRAAIAYVRAAEALRQSEPAHAAEQLRRAERLLASVRISG